MMRPVEPLRPGRDAVPELRAGLAARLAQGDRRRTRRHRAGAVLLAAVVAAVAAGSAVGVASARTTTVAYCFASDDPGGDVRSTVPLGGVVSADAVRDAIGTCEALWRAGVIDRGRTSAPADLVACRLDAAHWGVFPSDDADVAATVFCRRVGLAAGAVR